MKLLDFLASIERTDFKELCKGQCYFHIWQADLKDLRLNALLRLPKSVQERILEAYVEHCITSA